MRKTIVIFKAALAAAALAAAVFAVAVLASCSANNVRDTTPDKSEQDIGAVFQTVCSADEGLELARVSGLPVFERQGCTSGNDEWDKFFRTVSQGTPASVLCAHYYTLDKARMSAESYEEAKDKYPKLFFILVDYDGAVYSVKGRESTEEELDYQESFKYLLHLTGDAPSTALFTAYDNYVLADDPEATWEGIMAGMYSSQADAGIKHFTVYQNCLGWKETET